MTICLHPFWTGFAIGWMTAILAVVLLAVAAAQRRKR